MTYTVVARDPATREIGLGTVSHSTAVLGKILALADAGEDAALVASQAFSDPVLGREVAEACLAGTGAAALVQMCRRNEADRFRQVLSVDTHGTLMGFTGAGCLPSAAHLIDESAGLVIAGNMLRNEEVLAAGHRAFLESAGTLAEQILAALDACGAAGGDFRGDRAAGLVIRGAESSLLDLRVDDHAEPHAELRRLNALARKRGALADCYDWVVRGCPREDVQRLADRIEPDADDVDLGGWLWALTRYAELPSPDVSDESRRFGRELQARVVDFGSQEAMTG